MAINKVAETLNELRNQLIEARDGEILQADECLSQYITDHNDKGAYRAKDQRINRLVKAWDKMIARLAKWEDEADSIIASCENFYGD